MPPAGFIYYVYFHKTGHPVRIYVKTYMEFKDQLDVLIQQNSEMPEWIQRVYK